MIDNSLKQQVHKFFREHDFQKNTDIQVKQIGDLLLAHSDTGVFKHTNSNHDKVNEHIVEYLVLDTLTSQGKMLCIVSENDIDGLGTPSGTRCSVKEIDKKGLYKDIANISVDLVINPSNRADIERLLNEISQKYKDITCRKAEIIKLVTTAKEILDKFDGKNIKTSTFKRGTIKAKVTKFVCGASKKIANAVSQKKQSEKQ